MLLAGSHAVLAVRLSGLVACVPGTAGAQGFSLLFRALSGAVGVGVAVPRDFRFCRACT